MKIFENFGEFVNEAKKEQWTLVDSKKEVQMYRDSGKTWPAVSYSDKAKKIYARDNNGSRPSATLETSDITIGGLKRLLNSGISQPHPGDMMLQAFMDKIAELYESVDEGKKEDMLSKLFAGQNVKILTGRYKGKKGTILNVEFDDDGEVKDDQIDVTVDVPGKPVSYLGVADIVLDESVNEDEEDGRPKTVHNAIGPKQERFVIEGDADVVTKNEDKIMKILKKHDSDHRMQFYPVTGKIVGALKSHALKNVERDLRAIDKSIKIFVKPLKK